jgi:hypothetical protein
MSAATGVGSEVNFVIVGTTKRSSTKLTEKPNAKPGFMRARKRRTRFACVGSGDEKSDHEKPASTGHTRKCRSSGGVASAPIAPSARGM